MTRADLLNAQAEALEWVLEAEQVHVSTGSRHIQTRITNLRAEAAKAAEPLYCELCDRIGRRNDAEMMESEAAARHRETLTALADTGKKLAAAQNEIDRLQGKACLLCGAPKPCELADTEYAPCTFDPNPIQAARAFLDRAIKAETRHIERDALDEQQAQASKRLADERDEARAEAHAAVRRCAEICVDRQTPGTGSVAILNGAADAIRAEFPQAFAALPTVPKG